MTTAIGAPTEPAIIAPLTPDQPPAKTVPERVADLLAATLTTTQLCDQHFVRTNATVASNGSLTVRITQVNFDRPDCVVELLLHPTPPVFITTNDDTAPAAVEAGTGGVE